MNETITVNKYLSKGKADQPAEAKAKADLLKIVEDIIANNKKLHISAPVGTGKTFFAIDVVEHLGPEYKVLFLFPIIAISEQTQVEFNKRKIDAEIFNSTVDIEDVKDSQVILTTIDSTFKLLNDGFLNGQKVLIFLDETHTYLQKARKNFTKSVDAIIKSGFPIIGLSATPSLWVNTYLFEINDFINVQVKGFKAKTINPIEVHSGLLRYVGELIGKDQTKKYVVFIESINDQERLKQIIQEQWSDSKVLIFNSKAKKKKWKHLMKNGELPDDTDIAIINSVAQSGINIKNKDIDKVLLVDKHDPYGIAQYLGRCREYKGQFDYYFRPGGIKLKDSINSDYIQNRINLLSKLLDITSDNYYDDLKEIYSQLGGSFTVNENDSLIVNKCMIATGIYSLLRNVSGIQMMSEIEMLFSKDIIVNAIKTVPGITGTTSVQQKLKKDKERKALIKLMIKNSSELSDFGKYTDSKITHSGAIALLKKPALGLFQSIVTNKPIVKSEKEKKQLVKIIKAARKADRSIQRVITANEIYIKLGKKKAVLDKYILHKKAINRLYDAQDFFKNTLNKNEIVDNTLYEIEKMIDDVLSTDTWKKIVKSELGIATQSNRLDEIIFYSCLNFKNEEVTINGTRKKHRKLAGINNSIDEYLNNIIP